MIHHARAAAFVLLVAGSLSLSACGSEAPEPSLQEGGTAAESTTSAEMEAGGDTDDAGFSKPGVVMMLDSQLGAFGGEGRWDGDDLIMRFDAEFDEGNDLDLAFVCDLMNGLVLEEHTTAVETPHGMTDCTA